jgi:hypothetical protein
MTNEDFSPRLELALKALSISRGRLAAELGVDKSVVSRWLTGANAPSGHNLAALTALISARRAGFTMLDWDGDLTQLAEKLGVAGSPAEGAAASMGRLTEWLPPRVLQEGLATTAVRGEAYDGFWRTTRLSNEFPGRFVHDRALLRRIENGLIHFQLGVVDMRFVGWACPIQTQLFGFGVDERTGVFIFLILNAVLRHRADVMDGLSLTCLRNAGGTPVAAAFLAERTGLLSGDVDADDARYEASISPNPLAQEGSVSEAVRDHLFKDVGPAAWASGGDALLMMPFAQSLARGPIATSPLPS